MFPGQKERWLPGVLSKRQMEQLVDDSYLGGVENFKKSADYSSIDLTISEEGYKMINGCVKPFGETYSTLLKDTQIAEKLEPDSDNCFKLKPSNCYVFRLNEVLYPKIGDTDIFGQATAKSSIGRLDVIARLIVDGMSHYEYFYSSEVSKATGCMFVEIIPISFGIRVKKRTPLTQLRLFYGHPNNSIINDKNFVKSILHGSEDGEGYLTVDMNNIKISGHDVVAFCARNDNLDKNYIDIWNKDEKEQPCPSRFWQLVKSDARLRLMLQNGKFYILRSKERITLPPGVAVYAKAMDETLGEMRIHYAGFVHPFFGLERKDEKSGTPLIFEVRAHNVDVSLGDGERLAKLIFYRMSEDAEEEKKDAPKRKEEEKYNNQELTLSNHFADWPSKFKVDSNGKILLPKEKTS